MEKPALCAILASPEKLDESSRSPGSDETDTLGDFRRIRKWLKQSGLRNIKWLDQRIGQNLEKSQYYPIVKFAFKDAFDPMRNAFSPDLVEADEEVVFWYYAGHGLSKKAAAKLSYSSIPCLDRVQINPEYHEAADEFVKKFEGRKVKGGELCLHKVGFCDLYGLLKPWIAAVKTVKAKSINAKQAKGPAKSCSKKNKHLVIILDSCYSGIIAKELKQFEKYMEKKDSKFLQENSVTIQTACGPEEGALRSFFTPWFVYWNDRKNAELLRFLKADWMCNRDEDKNGYKELPLPSPMVVSTLLQFKQSQDVTLERKIDNFQFTLFPDPGFFKFCCIKANERLRNRTLNYLDGYLSFKKQQKEKRRSEWESSYLEHIKKFGIPKVAGN